MVLSVVAMASEVNDPAVRSGHAELHFKGIDKVVPKLFRVFDEVVAS